MPAELEMRSGKGRVDGRTERMRSRAGVGASDGGIGASMVGASTRRQGGERGDERGAQNVQSPLQNFHAKPCAKANPWTLMVGQRAGSEGAGESRRRANRGEERTAWRVGADGCERGRERERRHGRRGRRGPEVAPLRAHGGCAGGS